MLVILFLLFFISGCTETISKEIVKKSKEERSLEDKKLEDIDLQKIKEKLDIPVLKKLPKSISTRTSSSSSSSSSGRGGVGRVFIKVNETFDCVYELAEDNFLLLKSKKRNYEYDKVLVKDITSNYEWEIESVGVDLPLPYLLISEENKINSGDIESYKNLSDDNFICKKTNSYLSKNNPLICNNISLIETPLCFFQFAKKLNDKNLCKYTLNSIYHRECYAYFKDYGSYANICENLYEINERRSCYEKLAKISGNVSFCNSSSDIAVADCIKRNEEDSDIKDKEGAREYCRIESKKMSFDDCVESVARYLNNSDICFNAMNIDWCFIHIADYVEVCEKISTMDWKGYCYKQVAIRKRDGSICDKIPVKDNDSEKEEDRKRNTIKLQMYIKECRSFFGNSGNQ